MSEQSAVGTALDANRALIQQLRGVVATLAEEERRVTLKMQAIHHRMAMRRAQRAIDELAPQQQHGHGDDDSNEDDDIFAKKPESRYKPVSEVPRSYIRPKRSFFCDVAGASGTLPPRKRGRKPKGYKEEFLEQKQNAQLLNREDPSEPAPNADTLFLRQHSHEAFLAAPAKMFNPKEREIVKTFGEAQLKLASHQQEETLNGDTEYRIPLETWNVVTKRSKPPIHRSGFACMLRWELHDKPNLRLCAWTKDEDTALRALASGQVDPELVNHWEEIAKRMPFPGRPPVHCLIRYQTKLCASNLNTNFTPEEDALVYQAVGVFGERWNIIADLMDGRVPEQIRHRWQLSLSPQVKHGKFSIMEDRRMLLALYAYHDKQTPFRKENVSWTDVSHHVPGRLQPPLRDRFLNSLNSEISLNSWKQRDDEKLLNLVEQLGWHCPGLWARIAAELGNRSDSQVARRWRFLQPDAYAQYIKEKRDATTRTLPAIFQRPILGRPGTRAPGPHKRRSSYNVNDEPEPDALSAQSAAATTEERDGGVQIESFHGVVVCVIYQAASRSVIVSSSKSHRQRAFDERNSRMLTVSAASVKRTSLSSRGTTRPSVSSSGGGGSSRSLYSQFKMDDNYDPEASNRHTPIVTSTKATKCIRPKEWTSEVEEAFRVQQAGWRDLKEYMETYGQPERWENGFIRCTRVKSNGYYTYWRAYRECDDKYLHSVKVFEYA